MASDPSFQCVWMWGSGYPTPQNNSTQFWHYLSRNSIRFHRLTWWLSGEESPGNAGDTGLFLFGKLTWRRKWWPTPVFLLEKSHERGAWQTTVYRVIKSRTHDWTNAHHRLRAQHHNTSCIQVANASLFFWPISYKLDFPLPRWLD